MMKSIERFIAAITHYMANLSTKSRFSQNSVNQSLDSLKSGHLSSRPPRFPEIFADRLWPCQAVTWQIGVIWLNLGINWGYRVDMVGIGCDWHGIEAGASVIWPNNG